MLFFSILEGTTEVDPVARRITRTRFEKEIGEIIRGEAWGSMDITEPDAGSDMAALRSRGEQDEHGQWRVSGEKIFITSGHGKYHFVIARTEKATSGDDPLAGLGGLSMFLVPAYETEPEGGKRWLTAFDRIDEKLGHHGSVTAAQTFDGVPAHLIGKRGEGFRYMLVLMNNARLGVGFECLGLCEASLRLAREYAAGRPSMGKTIDKHELVADMLDEMHSDIEGIRALAMEAAVHEELSQKLKLELLFGPGQQSGADRRREARARRHALRARRLTPLLKYLAAEKAVQMARRSVQIHGGNGYMKEYGAEKLLRDAVVMPIYEGTSQIQALMAMKDTLTRILAHPRAFLARVAEARWRALSSRDPLERAVGRIQQSSLSVQQHLLTRTTADKVRSLRAVPVARWRDTFTRNWNPKRDFAFAMLHAERLTRLLADEAICEILLEQVKAHPDRRDVLARYLERAEPRCRYLAEQVNHGSTRLLTALRAAESFGAEAGT
jgi:3-(methylthio)propanoyl-CoA dehydrogenase